MSDVVFDEARHAYEVDGKELPSVTQLVAVLGDDGDIDEDILERAADRGTTCHAIIAMALQGEDYRGEYPAMYQPWVDSIEAFLHEHNIVPLMIETPLGNTTLGYAGTPDLVCEFDGATALLDYKCVSQVNKTKVKAQLNAYDQLLAYAQRHQSIFRDEAAHASFAGTSSRYHQLLCGQLAQPLRKFCQSDFAAAFVAEALLAWTLAGTDFEGLYGMIEKLF
jgi:hypothetical protein